VKSLDGNLQVHAGRQAVEPDLKDLLDDLRLAANSANADALRRATQRLDSLTRAANDSLRGTVTSSDRDRAVLQRVLAGEEFRPNPTDTLRLRFYRWLMNLLDRLLRGMSPGAVASVAHLILWGAGGAFLLLIGYLFYCLLPFLIPNWSRRPRVASDDAVEVSRVTPQSVDELLDAAERARTRGDFAQALRFVFRAMLVTLDQRKLLALDESRSNGEYLLALRRRPETHALVAPVTRRFDAVCYGGVAARPDDVDFCLARLTELRQPPPAAPANAS